MGMNIRSLRSVGAILKAAYHKYILSNPIYPKYYSIYNQYKIINEIFYILFFYYLSYGLNASLQNSYVETLIPNMMILGSGIFGRLLGLDKVRRIESP